MPTAEPTKIDTSPREGVGSGPGGSHSFPGNINDHGPAGRGRAGAGAALAAGLAGAWLAPIVAHQIGADALLPLLIWMATASLLRAGRTALDRLLLAAVLLIGATAVAGLVLSVWPWGLAPVPVAGAALTGIVLVAALLRRRPQLPWRLRGADLAALATGSAAAAVVALPHLNTDRADRLSLLMLGEDLARHFALYDAIGIAGGYAFLHPERTAPYLLDGMQTYPQGSHFLYALLDRFLRHGAPPAGPDDAFGHYLGFHVAGYALLAIALVWAARWVAGPGLLPVIAACATATATVIAGDLVSLFVHGYPSEILGLGLFAVLLALTARPLPRGREHIVLTAALLVGIGWAYFFLLPMAGLVCLASLALHRRRARRHWVTATVAAAVATPLALAPYLLMTPTVAALLPGGPPQGVNRALTAGLAALVLAGAAAARSPAWRMAGAQVLAVGAVTLLIGAYQIAATGELSYYFDKAIHALSVTSLVGLGALGPLLSRTVACRPAVAVLLASGIFLGYGAAPLHRPTADDTGPQRNVSWGLAYASGQLGNPRAGEVTAAVLRRYPARDERLTSVVFGNQDLSYLASLFVAVAHRDHGVRSRRLHAGTPLRLDTVQVEVAGSPAPQRIVVVNSPAAAAELREAARRNDLDIQVVSIRVAGA